MADPSVRAAAVSLLPLWIPFLGEIPSLQDTQAIKIYKIEVETNNAILVTLLGSFTEPADTAGIRGLCKIYTSGTPSRLLVGVLVPGQQYRYIVCSRTVCNSKQILAVLLKNQFACVFPARLCAPGSECLVPDLASTSRSY